MQTPKALCLFCKHALTRHSQHTFITYYCCSSSVVNSKPLVILFCKYVKSFQYGCTNTTFLPIFCRWTVKCRLAQHAPMVQQMKQPITEAQLNMLVSEYPKQDVMDILLAMENYADLHKKNISAYLTARAWLKRRIQVPQRHNPLQPKPGKVDMMLSVLNRISDDDKRNYSRDTADSTLLEY